ncbi:hypothetical protein R8Z50_21460 [Longispora sp. K20-0274]|uniref:hypothetical protein n=1 Tax=Longispora sp. K20-0274 TaxID=3088255 RepID=UPI00399BE409
MSITTKLRTAATLASVTIASTALLAIAPTSAQAADGCNYNSPITALPAVTVWGRTIELRANSNQICAWGRISNGSVGDQVWVDRSYNGGAIWEQLSITTITSGTGTFTDVFNDNGKVMRACGKAGNRPEIVCTKPWW